MSTNMDRVRWDETAAVARQLVRMRLAWLAFLVTVPFAIVVGYHVRGLEAAAATRQAVTLVAVAAGARSRCIRTRIACCAATSGCSCRCWLASR